MVDFSCSSTHPLVLVAVRSIARLELGSAQQKRLAYVELKQYLRDVGDAIGVHLSERLATRLAAQMASRQEVRKLILLSDVPQAHLASMVCETIVTSCTDHEDGRLLTI